MNSVKINNMSKKQLRSEINIGDAMIFTLAKENDLLREAITALEENVCIVKVPTGKSHDLDTISTLDDVARDLLAMAAAVGVLAVSHADLHG